MRFPRRGVGVAAALLGVLVVVPIHAADAPTASSIRTIVALAGVRTPVGLEDPAPLAAKVETTLSSLLREGGCEPVASPVFDGIWQRRVQEAGGFYDTVTGLTDPAKRRRLLAASLRELQEDHGARFVLHPDLVAATADFTRGKAEWDGAEEMAAPMGSGEVPALSIALRVEDLAGAEIASSRSGIQLLAKEKGSAFKPVPREKLLADDEKLRASLARGLTPLLAAIRAAPEVAPPPESGPSVVPAGELPTVEIEPPPEGAKVVALRRVTAVRGEVVVPPEVMDRCFERLRSRLEDAGWWALPPEAYEQTSRAVTVERGGLYDPITGAADAQKAKEIGDETRRRLSQAYGASALLRAGIALVQAPFQGETASWHGVTEQVTEIAGWKKALTRTTGSTKALSFMVVVEDANGVEIHVGWGGIQLLERFQGQRFVRVPDAELFRDPAREQQAIDGALRSWLEAAQKE